MTQPSPFRYFKTSPEIIRLAVMLYIRFPLSLRNVEDLLHERGVEISHETVRFWWNRFGPMFAAEIRRRRVDRMRARKHWRWHLDEVYVKINGVTHYLWRAVDHEGEVLESFVTLTRDRKAALKFLKKSMKRHGRPEVLVTDLLRSYGAALKDLGRGDDLKQPVELPQPGTQLRARLHRSGVGELGNPGADHLPHHLLRQLQVTADRLDPLAFGEM
uniref:IS6 family transposase n=1 Tax=Neogemmobacter tilapiae TaxID=875041 RepID=UPI001E4A473B|nr:IS6 family transposase [Gemmobacter tilapiae]